MRKIITLVFFISYFFSKGYSINSSTPYSLDTIINQDTLLLKGEKTLIENDLYTLLSERKQLQEELNKTKVLIGEMIYKDGQYIKAPWKPIPSRAVWLSLICPGAGQIYNRKYWKLPIVLGAFTSCIYAITTNQRLYKEYSTAYHAYVSDNPLKRTEWIDFLPNGTKPESSLNNYQLQTRLKNGTDRFHRYRDLSLIITAGVYLLTMLDAYVDATMFSFNVNDNLSLQLSPHIESSGFLNSNLSCGVACTISF